MIDSSMLSTSILIGTLFVVLWGAFLGMIRGRNRSILRLILVVISLVLALFLRSTLVEAFTTIEVEPGLTMEAMLIQEFMAGQSSEQMAEVIAIIVEILFSLISFIAIFGIASFLTWFIVFPICKIFVKKEKNKDGKRKAQKGVGALIGLVQGLLIAFLTFVPVSGMISQSVDVVLMMEQNASTSYEQTIDSGISTYSEESEEPTSDEGIKMLKEYKSSGIAQFYDGVGGWFFDTIASIDKVDETTGKTVKIKFGDATSVFGVFATFAGELNNINDAVENLDNDNIDSILKFSQSFGAIGEQVSQLKEGGVYLLDKMLVAIREESIANIEEEYAGVNQEYMNAGIEWAETITAENLRLNDACEAFEIVAESVMDGEPMTTTEANKVVSALADNPFILKLISAEQIRLEFTSIADFDLESKGKLLSELQELYQQGESEEVLQEIIDVLGLAS